MTNRNIWRHNNNEFKTAVNFSWQEAKVRKAKDSLKPEHFHIAEYQGISPLPGGWGSVLGQEVRQLRKHQVE